MIDFMSYIYGNSSLYQDYLLELNNLVNKTETEYNSLDPAGKKARADQINNILTEVFKKFVLGDESQYKIIDKDLITYTKNVYTLAKRAEKLQILSNSVKDILLQLTASPVTHNFTIEAKDGSIQVNSDILRESSDVFREMLDPKYIGQIKGDPTRHGTKEIKNNTLLLHDYSKETIEFLLLYLYTPPSTAIEVPLNDNKLVLELIDLAMMYGFNDLLRKLKPAVTNFIKINQDLIVENAEAWLNLLLLYAKPKEQSQIETKIAAKKSVALPAQETAKSLTANKWIADLTPHLLQAFGIPSTPSSIPESHEIFAKSSDAFFNEDTATLLQHLPVILSIRSSTFRSIPPHLTRRNTRHSQRSAQPAQMSRNTPACR